MIKVLVVEDSTVATELLVHILGADPQLRVVATAANGRVALEQLRRHQPDVITMDIHMPEMDGLEATRRIMSERPTPIVVVSASYDPGDVAKSFKALEAGALTIMGKPMGTRSADYEAMAAELTRTVRLMSEVRLVKRKYPPPVKEEGRSRARRDHPEPSEIEIVAIGASTGGPSVIREILSLLPGSFPVPLVIVQHTAEGFTHGFIEWLGRSSAMKVRAAIHGESMEAGSAYVVPEGYQLGAHGNGIFCLSKDPPMNGFRPSISYLFRSLAGSLGASAVGVLLSGMGKDGAAELKQLRDVGAVTIAQDAESSIVHGMAGSAIEQGAAVYVLPPANIARCLKQLVGCSEG